MGVGAVGHADALKHLHKGIRRAKHPQRVGQRPGARPQLRGTDGTSKNALGHVADLLPGAASVIERPKEGGHHRS